MSTLSNHPKKVTVKVQGSQTCYKGKRRGKENLNASSFQQGRSFPTHRGMSHEARRARGPGMKLELPGFTDSGNQGREGANLPFHWRL